MEWLHTLFFGNGIAHAVLTFALVITIGILLGKVKIGGVSLGITWILFVGIVLSHFGMTVDGEVRHFVQEFGLILFVFSIGLQVGPGFFASFKHGGMTLVMCAVAIVLLGVATAYVVHLVTGTPIPTMVGILSGAVTNTPGLGAAQQAYADASGIEDPTIALGYAVAYPLGVVGIIFTMIFIRYALRVKFEKEDEGLAALSRELGIWIVGGTIPEREGKKLYNTCYVYDDQGRQAARHRKIHLFDVNVEGGQYFMESDTFAPGNDITLLDTPWGRLGLCVCFDLRFEELCRVMTLRGARMILAPAAFNMTTGPAHWELLLRQRAGDNQLFTVLPPGFLSIL